MPSSRASDNFSRSRWANLVSKVERFLMTRFSMETSAVMMSSLSYITYLYSCWKQAITHSMWGISNCGTSKGSRGGIPSSGIPAGIICFRSSKICFRKSSTGSLTGFCWDNPTREIARIRKRLNFILFNRKNWCQDVWCLIFVLNILILKGLS